MLWKVTVCLFIGVALACCSQGGVDDAVTKRETSKPLPTPVAVAQSGTFRGSWMETRRGRKFHAYRGIRYAEAPVGELRFQPPKLINKYNEEVDATKEGPACPLPAPLTYFVAEDCLMLNVYTPDTNSTAPLPVIVYIHPGGFYAFTGRGDVAGPHYLLDRDVVLVTINYRLGVLGFISTGDEVAPGNNGMKDQVAALKWVQKNIAAFGGDPNLVTIAGCSAGSISVLTHMLSPMAKGLFHRGISSSASPINLAPMPSDNKKNTIRTAQLFNCPTQSSRAIVDCLKTKPFRELGESYLKLYEFGFDPVGLWGPVVEKDFGQERYLTEDPLQAIRSERMHPTPHLISQTTEEFSWNAHTILRNKTLTDTMNAEWDRIAPISFQLPRDQPALKTEKLRKAYFGEKPIVNDTASLRALGNLYGDSIIGVGVFNMANTMATFSPYPVYYAEFAYVGDHSHYEDPVTGKPTGAAHHDDMMYLFTMSYRFPMISLDSRDNQMVEKMTAIWYNFARVGDPNPQPDTPELGSTSWPVYKPNNRRYMRLDEKLTIHSNLKEERFKIWVELYPLWHK